MINISKRCDVSVLSPIYLDDEKRGALEGPFKNPLFSGRTVKQGEQGLIIRWFCFESCFLAVLVLVEPIWC